MVCLISVSKIFWCPSHELCIMCHNMRVMCYISHDCCVITWLCCRSVAWLWDWLQCSRNKSKMCSQDGKQQRNTQIAAAHEGANVFQVPLVLSFSQMWPVLTTRVICWKCSILRYWYHWKENSFCFHMMYHILRYVSYYKWSYGSPKTCVVENFKASKLKQIFFMFHEM